MEAVLPEVIEDYGYPITVAFAKDGRAYLSERITGKLWQIDHGNYRLIKTFPILPIIGQHETGLLGIALDPDFEQDPYIYCYYTYGDNPQNSRNKVVRIKDTGGSEETLIENLPAGWIHNGGIMAFAPDKTLYIGIGVDNERMNKSQDLNFLGGKVLRINRDGSFPKDNPFPNSPVYSYGHRNIFGISFHPVTGLAYISDVGPTENDEINIIQKGGNYGWPIVSGMNDNPKFTNPIMTYTPTITPTQNVFVKNDLYFGTYNEGTVHKLTLTGESFDQVEKDEVVYWGKPFGVLGVFFGTDGNFYLTFPDRIQKIDLTRKDFDLI